MKRAKFERFMDRARELPTLPVVAQKALEVIHRDRSSAAELCRFMEHDPVLAARALRLANTAYYRMPGTQEVEDLHRAVIVLGFMNIRNIVLTACLQSLYKPEFRTNHFSARDLWVHSIAVAVISRILADELAPELGEQAFLAGLVHDVGMIVEWNLFPDRFPHALNRFHGTGIDILTAEKEALGFDHAVAGASIMRRWGIPKSIRDAAARHHRPRPASGSNGALCNIVQAAERIACERGDGFFDNTDREVPVENVLKQLGLRGDAYRDIIDRTTAELHQAKDLLTP